MPFPSTFEIYFLLVFGILRSNVRVFYLYRLLSFFVDRPNAFQTNFRRSIQFLSNRRSRFFIRIDNNFAVSKIHNIVEVQLLQFEWTRPKNAAITQTTDCQALLNMTNSIGHRLAEYVRQRSYIILASISVVFSNIRRSVNNKIERDIIGFSGIWSGKKIKLNQKRFFSKKYLA